jgi:hypothetical protein
MHCIRVLGYDNVSPVSVTATTELWRAVSTKGSLCNLGLGFGNLRGYMDKSDGGKGNPIARRQTGVVGEVVKRDISDQRPAR